MRSGSWWMRWPAPGATRLGAWSSTRSSGWSRGDSSSGRVALALGVGFVPIRKAGKLPRATHAVSYQLEYGEATVEIHRDALLPGDRVLIVDDVLATGGTLAAARRLVEACGATAAGVAMLMELGFLGGRDAVGDLPFTVLTTV